MSLAILYSRACLGVQAPLVTVETHLAPGLPKLTIVGLPETVVKESKDRVRSALINSGFEFPARRITINLAPADIPKDGGRFDLPIALGILAASGQLPTAHLDDYEFAGELALSGALRAISGALPLALSAAQHQRQLILPQANAAEASFAQHIAVFGAEHLLEVCAHLNQSKRLTQHENAVQQRAPSYPDLCDLQQQAHAKRALEIAATGGHNLLLIGPPGTGKTLLASCLPGILPQMSEQAACESAAIRSIAHQRIDTSTWYTRPFRSPHHSASSAALVGGGNPPKPGEISLAHQGVLFLDELPEFQRAVLETLREPLESGHILISRAGIQIDFPANFQLIAAMNPCPCGFLGDSSGQCHCTQEQISRYQRKISGPFLDRIDLYVSMPRIPTHQLMQREKNLERSETIKARVMAHQAVQKQRQGSINAKLTQSALETFCQLQPEDKPFVQSVIEQFQLSPRGYHRLLKVSRTIADMAGKTTIAPAHIKHALAYRKLFHA